MLHIHKTALSLFLCLAVLVGSLATSIVADESEPSITSVKDQGLTSIVDKTLDVISMVKLAGKKYYDRDKIQFQIDEAKTLLELRLQYSDSVFQMLQGRLDEAEASVQKLTEVLRVKEEEQLKSDGSHVQSMETLEELSRSCLLEQQRLRWEAVVEETKIVGDSKTQSNNLKIERNRREVRKLEIEGIQQKLAIAKEVFERAKTGFAKGVASSTELKQAQGVILELETQLQIAHVNLDTAEAEAAHLEESSLEKSALQKRSVGERMKLINDQIEKLAGQKKYLNSFVAINSQIAHQRNLLQELKRQSQQVESERMSYEVLQKMLEKALEKSSSEPVEQSSKEPK